MSKINVFFYISEKYSSEHTIDLVLFKFLCDYVYEQEVEREYAFCPVGGSHTEGIIHDLAESHDQESHVELGHKRLKDASVVYIFSDGKDTKANVLYARCKKQGVKVFGTTRYDSTDVMVEFTARNSKKSWTERGYKFQDTNGRVFFGQMTNGLNIAITDGKTGVCVTSSVPDKHLDFAEDLYRRTSDDALYVQQLGPVIVNALRENVADFYHRMDTLLTS